MRLIGRAELKKLMEEFEPMDELGTHFMADMKGKLFKKFIDGHSGWEKLSIEEIKKRMIQHIEKDDWIDIANFALFAWAISQGRTGNEADDN